MDEELTREKLIEELRALHQQMLESDQAQYKYRKYQETRNRLQQSERKYKNLFETIKDIVYILSEDGSITSLNPAFEKITGWSCDEWIGKDFSKIFHPEDIAPAKEAFRDILQGGRPKIHLWRVRSKEGEYLFFEFYSSQNVENGKVVGVMGVARDITECKRHKAALKETEDRYQDLVEKAGVAILIDDKDGNFKYYNQKFLQLFGYSEEEMKNHSIRTLVHPEDVERVMVMHHDRLQAKDIKSKYEFRGKKKDGSTIHLEVSATLLKDEEKIIGTRSYLWDITERKKAESALYNRRAQLEDLVEQRTVELKEEITERKKAEEKLTRERDLLSRIMDTSLAGVVVMEPKAAEITFANPSAIKLLGLTKDEHTGIYKEPDWEVTDYEGKRYPDEKLAYCQVMKDRKPVYEIKYSIRFSDGRQVFLSINAAPLFSESGEIDGVVATLHDVTDQVKAKEALEQSEEKYKTLTENVNLGVYRTSVGTKGKFIEANPAFINMFGYQNKEELFKQNVSDLYQHPEDRKVFNEKMLRDRFVKNEILQLKRKDGSNFIGSVSVVAVTDAKGKVKFYDGIIKDITEQYLAEEALKESEEKYRTLTESILDAILIIDFKGKVLFANKSLANMFNFEKPEDGVGRNALDFVVPEYKDKVLNDLLEVYESGGRYVAEYKVKTQDGREFWVEAKGKKITYNDDPADLVVLRDATERKHAEQELKQSYNKLEKILDGTVRALASTTEKRDPYTAGHQHRVTRLACAIAEKMGLTETQIEGIRIAGILHDIGKIFVAAEILNKPVELNDIEMTLVREHCQVGHEILKTVEFPGPVAKIVLQHHERLDGSGYPQGLKKDEILIEAKILAVADVVEAMSSHRPYRSALSVDEALREISQNRGTLYDPQVVDICIELFKKYDFKFR